MKEQSPNHTYVPMTPTTDNDMLQRLKDSVEKQRDEIRVKEKLLQEKNSDVDNVILKQFSHNRKLDKIYFSAEISSGTTDEFQQRTASEAQIHAGASTYVVRRESRFLGATSRPAEGYIGSAAKVRACAERERGSGQGEYIVHAKRMFE